MQGRILTVDLASGRTSVSHISPELQRSLIGGRGLAAKLMLDLAPKGVSGLSPENVIVFATGPLTAFSVEGTDRLCIAAKSPLTGLLFNSSMGGIRQQSHACQHGCLGAHGKGGHPGLPGRQRWGGEFPGRGPTPRPFTPGSARRGQGPLQRAEVCTLGVAAEDLVPYSGIVHPRTTGRWGFAGRGGLGAVMFSKNVKAIVVRPSARGRATAADRMHAETPAGDEARPEEQPRGPAPTRHADGSLCLQRARLSGDPQPFGGTVRTRGRYLSRAAVA